VWTPRISPSRWRCAGVEEAAAAAKVRLLEPIDEISVLIPDHLVGAVMSDLSGRRGRVLGTDTAGNDRTLVKSKCHKSSWPATRSTCARSHTGSLVHPFVRPVRSPCRNPQHLESRPQTELPDTADRTYATPISTVIRACQLAPSFASLRSRPR